MTEETPLPAKNLIEQLKELSGLGEQFHDQFFDDRNKVGTKIDLLISSFTSGRLIKSLPLSTGRPGLSRRRRLLRRTDKPRGGPAALDPRNVELTTHPSSR